MKCPDTDAQESQGGMPDGSRHAANLTILSLDEFQGDPAVGDGFAHADRRITGRNVRLRVEQPRQARESSVTLDQNSGFQGREGFPRRNPLHLSPVATGMPTLRIEQTGIQTGFVAEKKKSLGVGIESADRIDSLGESEFRQRPVGRSIRSKLGEDSVGFVEGKDHGLILPEMIFLYFLKAIRSAPHTSSNQIGRRAMAWAMADSEE